METIKQMKKKSELFKNPYSKKNKYNAEEVQLGEVHFASKAEACRYTELTLLEKAGEICDLRVHPRFTLLPAVKLPNGKKLRGVRYTADFEYREGDKLVVEDVKGVLTRDFGLRINLFCRIYPEIELRIQRSKKSGRSVVFYQEG